MLSSRARRKCLAIAALASTSLPAFAQEVRYELDSDAELTADGWKQWSVANESMSFSDGELSIDTKGYSQWLLYAESGAQWFTASDETGWWVEARVRVAATTDCTATSGSGLGIWANPGDYLVSLYLETGRAGLTSPQASFVDLDTTDAFHVYRIQNLTKGHLQLLIDGVLVIDQPAASGIAGSTVSLSFGDMGACGSTNSTWDYVAFDDIAPPAPPGDDDGDGVDGPDDNCAIVPNATQEDADGDRIGDACDPCPNDASNDIDDDGLCADADPCPSDSRNDSDNDGVCDTEQCMNATAMGACLALCGCFPMAGCPGFAPSPVFPCMVGIDPIGGFGGTLGSTGGTGGVGGRAVGGSGGVSDGNGGAAGSGRGGTTGGVVDESGGSVSMSAGRADPGGGSGGSAATGGTSDAAGAGNADGSEGEPTTVEHRSGCSCATPSSDPSGLALAALAGTIAITALRRRRRKG